MGVLTGPEKLHDRWRPLAWLALVAVMLNPLLVVAQNAETATALLKPGDSVQLIVPGRPNLTQEIVLDAAGQAVIEPVGRVQLGGLSVADATQTLKHKLRLFYPTLDTLHIEVARSGSMRIYVIGGASQQGVVNFVSAPTLWDVVRAIGGPGDNANLRDARVIRMVDGQPQVFPLDLSGVMKGEGVPVFTMEDGDTLIIPTLMEGIPGVASADGVKVFGSVGVPTVVPIEEGTPLMDVLMLAGAPTQTANMKKIYWVHHDGDRNQAEIIDLQKYLRSGDDLSNPLVYPGDTIRVEYTKAPWYPVFLATVLAAVTVFLAYDSISNR